MSTEKGHPTRDELLIMAYVDDELAAGARDDFQARLATEPELLRQVVEYQKLEILARQMAPPEPQDYEWERLTEAGWHKAGQGLGWILLFSGSIGLVGWMALLVYQADMPLAGKAGLGALLAGFTCLLLLRLRVRLRLLPYDPYTEVKR